MYDVDDRDRVVELKNVPQSSVGAPLPCLMSDERRVVLAYYIQHAPMAPSEASEPVAVIRFSLCYAHMFGPPNNEAFHGHPLARRGLHPYGAFEVSDSSWIRRLERMNSVHPHHRPERFWKRRHLIFAFHDTTFECVCDGFDVKLTQGSIASAVPEMMKQLEWNVG